ncbi:hypothetical protein DdX_22248 [Ditylenchus destructor]|uniref:Uncharacterized protein n=1 Tax=Ditylenchus destructor TaxID=166010 RepID=A0AAD4MEM2_9BILA|nr:hypothetical protein DdX_22248 [Ditylenchus destructor]
MVSVTLFRHSTDSSIIRTISAILLLLGLTKSSDALFPGGPRYLRHFRQSSRNWAENRSGAPFLDTLEHKSQKPAEIIVHFSLNSDPMKGMPVENPKLGKEVTQKSSVPTTNAFRRRPGTHRRKHLPKQLGRTLPQAVSTTEIPVQIRKKLPKSKNPLCYFTAIPCMDRR